MTKSEKVCLSAEDRVECLMKLSSATAEGADDTTSLMFIKVMWEVEIETQPRMSLLLIATSYRESWGRLNQEQSFFLDELPQKLSSLLNEGWELSWGSELISGTTAYSRAFTPLTRYTTLDAPKTSMAVSKPSSMR